MDAKNNLTAAGTGGLQATGWVGQLMIAALTIISTWRLFAGEIHGYIDAELLEIREEVTRDMGHIGQGHMLMLTDSLRAFEERQNLRLDAIEERIENPQPRRR